jgi:uncharacterized RDD family membrane protein YckC
LISRRRFAVKPCSLRSARRLASPGASLHERRLAATLDGALILFAYGAFLSLFSLLGGRFAASKLDAAVLLATLALFYGQYFALFTLFGGVTPGMIWRKLRLATFDGHEPGVGHLACRSFGYMVSAGTLALGFLWALWDEDRLCWHDRISHTHLTWTAEFLPVPVCISSSDTSTDERLSPYCNSLGSDAVGRILRASKRG